MGNLLHKGKLDGRYPHKDGTITVPEPRDLFRSGELAKTALITGITGQDGAYLAEFLLAKDTRSTA